MENQTVANEMTLGALMQALDNAVQAMAKVFALFPSWSGPVLFGLLAIVFGLMMGFYMGGRRKKPDVAKTPSLPPSLPAPENPAFKSHQQFLYNKGIPAKELDQQMRDFAGVFKEMRGRLRDVQPGNPELETKVEATRDALDEGDFSDALDMINMIGESEGHEGERMHRHAIKHLMASANARVVAGDLLMARMDYVAATVCYQKAVECLPAFQEDLNAEFLNKHGTAAYQSGDHKAAIVSFERALGLLQKRLGKNHPDVAAALNNLALLHYSRGNYDAAEPLYERSLKIDEQILGPDHTGVATDLNNLALLYKKQGDLEKAEPLLKRALDIKEKNFDPGHPSLVTGLKNYASVLKSMGRGEEAETYDARASVLPPSRRDLAAE